jgi:hypothetical protein
MKIGRITGSEIKKNKDGDNNVLLLQVEITDPDDIQTIELIRQSGEDYVPQNDSSVVIADLGPAYRVGIAVDDGVEPSVSSGERELYSYDENRSKQSWIRILTNSDVEINGNDDNAVRYSVLKAQFDQLKSDFDQAMIYINTHTHNDSLGAPTTPPLLPSPPWPAPGIQSSTADMSGAKIDNIKVPS